MKLGVVAALSAFILSLLLGFVSGAGFLAVLLRALLFAALFFGLSFGAQVLVSRFLPDLLALPTEESAENESGLGARIDVVVGDEEAETGMEEVVTGMVRQRNPAEDEEVEEIEAFLPESGLGGGGAEIADEVGLDQGREGRYTENKVSKGVSSAPGGKSAEPALPPGLIDDVDVLPDLDSMSDSFVAPLVEEATERSSGEQFTSRSSSAPRSSGTGGDFDSHEMAAAIQTILKRDQKG